MTTTTTTTLPPLTDHKKLYRNESNLTVATSVWDDEMGATSDQLFFVTGYRYDSFS
jgi:hypothetical protein